MKNQKGITLVALVVTIIVLVILAGIVISILMSDNSALRQVNSAKVTNIQGTVNEEVKLACGAMRIAVAEAQAQKNSYSVLKNAEEIRATLERILNDDTYSKEDNVYTVTGPDANNKLLVTYETEEYKEATNKNDAKITFDIQLQQSTIELVKDSMNATALSTQIGGKNVITINEITNSTNR